MSSEFYGPKASTNLGAKMRVEIIILIINIHTVPYTSCTVELLNV
jgi:hypothetical protein